MERISLGGQAVQGDLYLETLRALVLENQPALVQRLLDLRDRGLALAAGTAGITPGGVRMGAEEMERGEPIVELARRALKAWRKTTSAGAGAGAQ